MSQSTDAIRKMAIIYDSRKEPPAPIAELQAVFQFPDLIGQLIYRDLVARYKRSFFGVLWTMLNPLGSMIILSLVFSRVFEIKGVYPAYIITNLLGWNFFAQTTQFSLNIMLFGNELSRKIYMPRTAMILATVITGLINMGMAFIPLVLIYLFTGTPLAPSALLFPIVALYLAAFTLGISLLVSTFAVMFPDVGEFFPVLLMGYMYLTPIIYPASLIQDVAGGWLLRLNPMAHLLDLLQRVLFIGELPGLSAWALGALISFATLIIGWVVFTRASKRFSYYA